MIITSWKRTVRDGKDGVLYLVTNEDEGNHSDEGKWVSGDVISNKKMLQDFWNIQFGKDRIGDIYLDDRDDSFMIVKTVSDDREIHLKREEVGKERIIDFLRRIPPGAHFEIVGQCVHVQSPNHGNIDSKIKITWMKKCQTNTLRAFIKFLTSDEAQMQIRQCKLKPLLAEAQCQPKKPLVSTVPLSMNKPQIRKASGDSPFYVQQTKNMDASSSSFIICGLVAKDKNAVHLLGNISQF